MFLNIDTIGKRLFLSFSILAINVIIISVLAYHFIDRNKNIYTVSKHIESQRIQILRLLRLDLDFLRFETINQEFYRTNTSALIVKRDSLYAVILHETRALSNDATISSLGIIDPFSPIDKTLKKYNETFLSIKEKIAERGFKDYGLEGTMRKYAHELEKHSQEISLVDVLTLRRHEKDYFLRREKQYQTKLNEVAAQITAGIKAKKKESDFLLYLIKSYQDSFNQLATMDEAIGLLPTQGLLGELNSLSNVLSDKLEILVTQSDKRAALVVQQSLVTYIIIGMIAIIISFALTYITALRLTRPIKKLSGTIARYMVTQGLNEDELIDTTVTNEINNLSSAFIKMTRKLKAQFAEIERKSELVEKRNKELQKLNNELDRFIYSAAHDLKSPLASMEGLIYLAKREINVPEHEHYFDKISTSIDKMEGFIRDITDYAKNKRQKIKPDKIDLADTIQQVFESLQFIPHADGIDKIIHVEQGEFFTDRTRLEIIVKNILSNAIRYSDSTRQKSFINISARVSDAHVTIRFEDNGIGIAPEHVPKIFDMFYRATDAAKGSGIGLFLVRESVKMLRGTVRVYSTLGVGTSFTLNLPNLKHMNVDHLPESEPLALLTAVS